MLSSLSARLFVIVGAAALALLVTLIGSAIIGAQQTRDVQVIEQRLIPKLELGPKLDSEFEHLRQTMQDAASAQDPQALEAALERRKRLFELIAESRGVLDPSDAAELRWNVQDYYESAHDVTSRLIAGETGEALVDKMARMQVLQTKVSELIKHTTGLNRETLASSFSTIERANERAFRFRLAIGLAGLLVLLSCSLSVSRSVLRNIRELSSGLSRFATGDFASKIPVTGLKELSKLAREANQMAMELERLAQQREREDWLKESQARLSDELRGEVLPGLLAERLVRFIALRTGAVAAALYLLEDGGLHLRGRYAMSNSSEFVALDPLSQASTGDGLLVEATRSAGLFVVDSVPEGYLKVKVELEGGQLVENAQHARLLAAHSQLGNDWCLGVGIVQALLTRGFRTAHLRAGNARGQLAGGGLARSVARGIGAHAAPGRAPDGSGGRAARQQPGAAQSARRATRGERGARASAPDLEPAKRRAGGGAATCATKGRGTRQDELL